MQSFSDALSSCDKKAGQRDFIQTEMRSLGVCLSFQTIRRPYGFTLVFFYSFFLVKRLYFSRIFFYFLRVHFIVCFPPTLFESSVFVFVDCYYNCSGKLVVKSHGRRAAFSGRVFICALESKKYGNRAHNKRPLTRIYFPTKKKQQK